MLPRIIFEHFDAFSMPGPKYRPALELRQPYA